LEKHEDLEWHMGQANYSLISPTTPRLWPWQYNLVGPFTNFLAVMESAKVERPCDLQDLRTMLDNIPRGW
jgi:hypothetical protein